MDWRLPLGYRFIVSSAGLATAQLSLHHFTSLLWRLSKGNAKDISDFSRLD